MNAAVILFFVHNVLATALLGSRFASKGSPVVKHFGIALLLNSVAFVIWSGAVILQPANLDSYVTVGVLFFVAALVEFLRAGTQQLHEEDRRIVLGLGIVVGLILFYLRAFVLPSTASFSEAGLFFFNPHPMMQLLYIFGLTLTALPAIDALAATFTSWYASLIRYGFIAQVAGGIILITAADSGAANTLSLYLAGWIMGLSYLALWTVFLLHKKAWAK